MLRIADQTAGPIGLIFLLTLMVNQGVSLANKNWKTFFKHFLKNIFLNFFNPRPFTW